ncbi:MAG: M23 family metallopeptidase [Gemmatimonadaceae bacterium]|nr:M23 family metallopeptidase [Gemmatimonadaceae bacterium]
MPTVLLRRASTGRTLVTVLLTGCTAPLARGVPDLGRAPVPVPVAVAPVARAVSDAARERADRRLTDDDLRYVAARELMVPVDGIAVARVLDTFDALRKDAEGRTRAHAALDIMAPRGTPVLAADDAVVGRLSSNALGGITIYLRDLADRFVHYYAHLERYREGLAVGDTVTKGTVLGYVGTTGNAPRETPHLHWQLMQRGAARWWDGVPLNPWHFLALDGRARERATFTSQPQR